MVDTGALLTAAMDEQTAIRNGFIIQPYPTQLRLRGANNICLKLVGLTVQETSIRLNNTTKILYIEYHVIRDLPVDVIIGKKTLRRLRICIRCDTESETLHYIDDEEEIASKHASVNAIEPIMSTSKPKGPIISASAVEIPERSQKFINVIVEAVGDILTKPSNNNSGLNIANGIYRPVHSRYDILVMNPTQVPIRLAKSAKIARYEVLEKIEECIEKVHCNAILPIDDKGATIEVGDDLSVEQIKDIKRTVREYSDIFAFNGELGSTTVCEHTIELLPNASPVAEHLRRHAPVEKAAVTKQMENMLRQDIIEESTSLWASAYVLVKKKNGQTRFCVDYRAVNACTKRNAYPLPRLDDCLDFMANKVYFSLLDFKSGYWQIPMAPSAREITAFRTHEGHWQFKVMPFGLTNSGASFQRMVDAVSSGLKNEALMVFIDDVCVASPNWSEHMSSLRSVFDRIRTSNLKLQPPKCILGATTITF